MANILDFNKRKMLEETKKKFEAGEIIYDDLTMEEINYIFKDGDPLKDYLKKNDNLKNYYNERPNAVDELLDLLYKNIMVPELEQDSDNIKSINEDNSSNKQKVTVYTMLYEIDKDRYEFIELLSSKDLLSKGSKIMEQYIEKRYKDCKYKYIGSNTEHSIQYYYFIVEKNNKEIIHVKIICKPYKI